MNYARMRDKNEAEIVKALRGAGASVTPLNGAGVPDLLVGFAGRTFLLEVKTLERTKGGASMKCAGGDGVLTAAQIKWWREWTGAEPVVVQTPAEALAVIGVQQL